jgi:hypothetical protein
LFHIYCSKNHLFSNVHIIGPYETVAGDPFVKTFFLFVYYEEIKRDLNRRLIYVCRCNERLKVKTEGSTRLPYTGLSGGLEPLKIETRSRGERFESAKGECVIQKRLVCHLY